MSHEIICICIRAARNLWLQLRMLLWLRQTNLGYSFTAYRAIVWLTWTSLSQFSLSS